MKLRCTFEAIDMGDEIISVPIGKDVGIFQGVLKQNAGAAEIVALLNEETTEELIVKTLAEKYENDQQTLANYVRKVVEALRTAGLIEE